MASTYRVPSLTTGQFDKVQTPTTVRINLHRRFCTAVTCKSSRGDFQHGQVSKLRIKCNRPFTSPVRQGVIFLHRDDLDVLEVFQAALDLMYSRS